MTAELTELQELTAELNAVVAQLPPEMQRRVVNYARMLKLSPTGTVEMGELTDDDKLAIAQSVFRRFDEEHPGEDWSHLRKTTPKGYK